MLADSGSSGGGGAAVLGLLILLGFYFLPTIVAVIRKVPNMGSVIVINLFLGWSIIGWIVALAMAARSVPTPQQVIVNQYTSPQVPPPPAPTHGRAPPVNPRDSS
jgi:hypothetical protein